MRKVNPTLVGAFVLGAIGLRNQVITLMNLLGSRSGGLTAFLPAGHTFLAGEGWVGGRRTPGKNFSFSISFCYNYEKVHAFLLDLYSAFL